MRQKPIMALKCLACDNIYEGRTKTCPACGKGDSIVVSDPTQRIAEPATGTTLCGIFMLISGTLTLALPKPQVGLVSLSLGVLLLNYTAAGYALGRRALKLGGPFLTAAAFLSVVDTANGIAVRQDPREWMFPNVDLSVHLWRQPVPGWVGLDTTVVFGTGGVGLTSSTLHDVEGPVGRCEQILTVRRLPPPAE